MPPGALTTCLNDPHPNFSLCAGRQGFAAGDNGFRHVSAGVRMI